MPIYTPGKVTLAKGQPVPNDPNFAFNSLLLHGNGTNGSTVITDSSGSPKTVTVVADAKISTAQSKFGGSSIAFDGTGDRLNCPIIDFQVDKFTIETWAYLNSTSGFRVIAGNWKNEQCIFSQDGVNLQFYWAPFNVGATLLAASGLVANQWQHLVVSKDGSTFRLFINGVLVNTATSAQSIPPSTTNFLIGTYPDVNGLPTGNNYNGYLDDFRITLGVARYTSNFTPPTLPFPDF
jgi:hypothetical protein